jgi:hypothetical protein
VSSITVVFLHRRSKAWIAGAAFFTSGMISGVVSLCRFSEVKIGRDEDTAYVLCRSAQRSDKESERLAREQAEYETKMAAREAKARPHGKKPGGKPPAPPVAGPGPSDQINLTDADSRIMPVAGGVFEQCYNAQAAVTADSLLVVATDVVQAANDKQQIEPMLGQLATLPTDLGRPQTLLGDA